MGKIHAVICDDNAMMREMMKDALKSDEQIVIDGYGVDGESAITMIEKYQPDIVLLDLVMPKIDGIGVLERINNNAAIKKPKFIVISAMIQEDVIRDVFSMGVKYYIMKPFDDRDLRRRIRKICNGIQNVVVRTEFPLCEHIYEHDAVITKDERGGDLVDEVTHFICQLGIPAHIKGYQYVREGILMMIENPDYTTVITKILYPTIAEKYSSTASRVERAIRHAIDVAWSRGDVELRNKLFGYSFNSIRPTNSEFMAAVSDRIRMQRRLEKNIG